MKFSLIMPTVDRTFEVARFLQFLNAQTCRDFELIVVDQNQDDRLLEVIQPYLGSFSLVHIRTDKRGAARARNLGLQHVSGDIIGFPDDDCWYEPDLLEKIQVFFNHHPEWDGFAGRATDMEGKNVALRFDRRPGAINRYNAWRRGLTFTMFFRHSTIADIKGFDDELGVGAGTPWGSGEETDFLIRLVDAGIQVFYVPELRFFHPDPLQTTPEKLLARAISYGRGMGRVMRKNQFPGWFLGYYLLRSCGGGVAALLRNDWAQVRYYRASFQGRLYGWRKGRGDI